MPLPHHADFLSCLEEMLMHFGHHGTGSASHTGVSSHKVASGAKPPRELEIYASDTGKVDVDWYGARKAGYLAAYVKFFGPRFSYERFSFAEGDMYPDLANMKTYFRYGCIVPAGGGRVRLTEKGRALIAPFVIVSDQDMSIS